MNIKTPNIPTPIELRQVGYAAVLAGSLAVAACGTSQEIDAGFDPMQDAVEVTMDIDAPALPNTTQPETPPHESLTMNETEMTAADYINSEQRYQGMQGMMNDVGPRLVDYITSGGPGSYETHLGSFENPNGVDEGQYVLLQRLPKDGDEVRNYVTVTAFQRPDGSFDLGQDIPAISVELGAQNGAENGEGAVSITVQSRNQTISAEAASIIDYSQPANTRSDRDFTQAPGSTAEDVQEFDDLISDRLQTFADSLPEAA